MLIISGKTSCGKDTIANELVKLGCEKIPTYTTRKKRDGEIDGYSYHFITDEEFDRKLNNGFFLETQTFDKSDEGSVRYGTSIESLFNAKINSFIILTPCGIKKLKASNILSTVVYVDVSDEIIKERQRARGDATEDEMNRRLNQDKIDFADIHKLCDYKLINEHKTPYEIAKQIYNLI